MTTPLPLSLILNPGTCLAVLCYNCNHKSYITFFRTHALGVLRFVRSCISVHTDYCNSIDISLIFIVMYWISTYPSVEVSMLLFQVPPSLPSFLLYLSQKCSESWLYHYVQTLPRVLSSLTSHRVMLIVQLVLAKNFILSKKKHFG